MAHGRLWTQRDRYGTEVYLTEERWQHIVDPDNHPDVEPYAEHIRETIRRGRRVQEPLKPDTYRYSLEFDDLPDFQTHVVVVVVLRQPDPVESQRAQQGFVVTAYLKEDH